MGFSLTHLSGTGIPDLGDFLFIPGTGEMKLEPGTHEIPIKAIVRVIHMIRSGRPPIIMLWNWQTMESKPK